MFDSFSLIFVVVAIIGGQWWWDRNQLEKAAREWCRSRGFVYLRHDVIQQPRRRGRYGPLQPGRVHIEFRRGSTGETEGGNADWIRGALAYQIVFDRPVLPDVPQSMLPVEEMPFVVDTQEVQVSVEVARRLDTITRTPGWIEEHDLDGSGHIDSEEWDILRERVIAEVRAELEVAGAERNQAAVPVSEEEPDQGWW